MMMRSILGQLMPEAMVHFLENHGECGKLLAGAYERRDHKLLLLAVPKYYGQK